LRPVKFGSLYAFQNRAFALHQVLEHQRARRGSVAVFDRFADVIVSGDGCAFVAQGIGDGEASG